MPTYTYRCTACSNEFDIVQTFTDDSLTQCEQCGGSLRKVFNTVGVTFNGSGFYRTDSRQSPKESQAGKTSPGGGSKSEKTPSAPEKPSSSSGEKKTSSSSSPTTSTTTPT